MVTVIQFQKTSVQFPKFKKKKKEEEKEEKEEKEEEKNTHVTTSFKLCFRR